MYSCDIVLAIEFFLKEEFLHYQPLKGRLYLLGKQAAHAIYKNHLNSK